jgi:hypothetical protein
MPATTGRLTERERSETETSQVKTVAEGTQEAYERDWLIWTSYLEQLEDLTLRRNPYLQHLAKDWSEQAARLAHFGIHCTTSKLGLSRSRVQKILSAMRYKFETALHDSRCFGEPSIKRTRKGPTLSAQELREAAQKKEQTVKLPVFSKMIMDMRAEYVGKTDPATSDGIDKRSTYCGCAYGLDKGHRVGEYTLREGKRADHCIRASLVEITFAGGAVLTVGDPLREYLRANPQWEAESVWFNHPSSKAGKRENSIFGRTELEKQFMHDLISFWRDAGTMPTDEIFTRYHQGSRKVLTRREVNKAIKDFGVTSGGAPRTRFSSKSLRIGSNVQLRLAGVPAEERNENGGWAKGSTVPDRHYDVDIPCTTAPQARQTCSRGVFATIGDPNNTAAGFTKQHIATLLTRGGST